MMLATRCACELSARLTAPAAADERALIGSAILRGSTCPLGPAGDFLELGRVVRDLLPDAWGEQAWKSYRKALVAARSKESGSVPELRKQGVQGEMLMLKPGQPFVKQPPQACRGPSGTIRVPPPGRDYSGMAGVTREKIIDPYTGAYTYER